ncbi:MAG: type II toxin-antitoxin system RelE/ParE family toxin [Comamonas sp.]
MVAQSGGVRKIRWTRAHAGKSGGVRVIYFTRTEAGEVVLLIMYAKSHLDTLKASTLKELRNAVEKSRHTHDRR